MIIFNEFELSSPEVGSSKIRHNGSEISYKPIATLFLCPPEIDFFPLPPIYEFFTSYKFSSLNILLIDFCLSYLELLNIFSYD